MVRYEEYKDSGVGWIGEVPVDWDIKKIKHGFYVKGRIGWKGLKSSEFLSEGFSYLVTGTDFKAGKIDWKNCYHIDKDRYEEDPYIQLREHDLLITKDGTIGKLAIIDELDKPACLNSGIFVVRSLNRDFATRYLYWVLMSNVFAQFNNYTSYGSTIQHLYQNIFVEFSFGFPTPEEQIAIANFLDRKTAEIDALIVQKERLLELYEEEKAAIINQAVTKGIDPNVELKDSGVEWIGDIPVRWKIKRFRYLFDSVTERTEDDLPKIGLENIENKTGKLIETNSRFDGDGIHFMFGDILFGKLRPYLAKVHLAEFEGKAVGDFFVFRSKNEIYERFGARLISSKSFIEITNGSTFGAKMPRVSWDFVSNLLIAYPNTEEQTAIANFLDCKVAEIDAKIARTQRIIELQEEYRATLISDVI